MKYLVPTTTLNQGLIRNVGVSETALGDKANFRNRTNIPREALSETREYVSDPQQFIRRFKEQLPRDPARWLNALAIYTTDIARQAENGRREPGNNVITLANTDAPAGGPRAIVPGADRRLSVPTTGREFNPVARVKLAELRRALEELFANGVLTEPRTPIDAAAIFASALAVGIPLGKIRVSSQPSSSTVSSLKSAVGDLLAKFKLKRSAASTDEVIRAILESSAGGKLLVELTSPESVGFAGRDVVDFTATNTTQTGLLAAYVRTTSGSAPNDNVKVTPAVTALVKNKLECMGLVSDDAGVVELVRAFAAGTPGSAVAALRQLELTSPDLVPRLQRILRKYGDSELLYDTRMSSLQRAGRVMNLLFGADAGLRAVQAQAMRADLQARSDALRTLIKERPDEAVWDVFVGGVGLHGSGAIGRIVAVNPELRVFAADAASVSNNFGRSGVSFFMNSRNGQDDGRPGGNGRGNINPVGAELLSTDISGTNMPKPRDVDDTAVTNVHDAVQRGHVDTMFGTAITNIEHRDLERIPDSAVWKAAYRITFADGTKAFAHKVVLTNGFGLQPKSYGDEASDAAFAKAVTQGRAEIARWREGLVRSQIEGESSEPNLDARVMLVADALAAGDTPGADALAPFRAVAPTPTYERESTASVIFQGFGDSNRTALELVLGLAPDEAYRNTPAQLGQIKDMVWVVGNGGPTSCFEFLVGRDYLGRSLSPEAYDAFMKVLGDSRVEELFENSTMMAEIRSKLGAIDQQALDGARTRYQKISGAILKGIVRLEAANVTKFYENSDSITLQLSDGKTLTSRRLIDGRGYEAELGPVAGLVTSEPANARSRIKDCKDLRLVEAPVEDGVIGRNDAGLAAVAKTIAGLEKSFFWCGPGNGGDLVSKADIAKKTKVGANTVSLFVNMPRTYAVVDEYVGLGPTLTGPSLSELYPQSRPKATRTDKAVSRAKSVDFADLAPAELNGDSRLEVHARLASILNGFDLSSFSEGETVGFALRKPEVNRSMRQFAGVGIEISSSTLDRRTLGAIADTIFGDKRFAALTLQMLQESDIALEVRGTRGANGAVNVPTSRLESVDAGDIEAPPVVDAQTRSFIETRLSLAATGSPVELADLQMVGEYAEEGVLTSRELREAIDAGQIINDRKALDALRAGDNTSAIAAAVAAGVARGTYRQADVLAATLRAEEDRSAERLKQLNDTVAAKQARDSLAAAKAQNMNEDQALKDRKASGDPAVEAAAQDAARARESASRLRTQAQAESILEALRSGNVPGTDAWSAVRDAVITGALTTAPVNRAIQAGRGLLQERLVAAERLASLPGVTATGVVIGVDGTRLQIRAIDTAERELFTAWAQQTTNRQLADYATSVLKKLPA